MSECVLCWWCCWCCCRDVRLLLSLCWRVLRSTRSSSLPARGRGWSEEGWCYTRDQCPCSQQSGQELSSPAFTPRVRKSHSPNSHASLFSLSLACQSESIALVAAGWSRFNSARSAPKVFARPPARRLNYGWLYGAG